MRHKLVVLNILILFFNHAAVLSYGLTGKGVRCLEGLRNYELLYDDMQDDQSIEEQFWIARVENDINYQILDSLMAAVIEACDTNAILFDAVDDTNTHLISLRLSPALTYDTLISQNNKAPDNWLKDLPNGFCCSLRDSVIAYCPGSVPHNVEIKILKILPRNKWLEKHSMPGVDFFSISKDFSQIFICTSRSPGYGRKEGGKVLIYDIYQDSLYEVPQLGYNNLGTKRYSRDSSIYTLKRDSTVSNLWEYSKGNGIKQITYLKYPEVVVDFEVFDDKIIYIYRDVTDNTPIGRRTELKLDER